MKRYLMYIFPNESNNSWKRVPYWLSRVSHNRDGSFGYDDDDSKSELVDKRRADAGVEWLIDGVLNTDSWDLRIKEES